MYILFNINQLVAGDLFKVFCIELFLLGPAQYILHQRLKIISCGLKQKLKEISESKLPRSHPQLIG